MGFFSDILGAAAPVVGGIFGGPIGASIGGAVGGLLGSKSAPSSATTTQQQQLDPRIQSMLFGQNGQTGLLDQYKGYLDQPQSAALQGYGKAAGDYLTNYGAGNAQQIQGAAGSLMQPGQAKMADLLGYSVGNKVQAPSQNSTDLSGSYDSLVNGQPGANPYLQKSIAGGIAQSQNGFDQMQRDATDNLQRNILPGIRSNSVLAGQYGGSRQGIAEGNAIGDFGKAMAGATSQFGQNNTNAATAASLSAYDSDRNRQLAATTGLGAQQYGVASQDANTKNQAEFMNVNNLWDASKTNANATNQMTQVNNAATLGGAGLLGGLTSSMYGTAQNADNASVNRATQVNGLLAPYMSANSGSTSTQPLYQNTGGNILGGAMAGLGLYNQFSGSGNYNSIRNNDNYGVNTGNTGVFGNTSSNLGYTPTAITTPNLPSLWG